jgi:hypothetical protein
MDCKFVRKDSFGNDNGRKISCLTFSIQGSFYDASSDTCKGVLDITFHQHYNEKLEPTLTQLKKNAVFLASFIKDKNCH